MLVKERTKTRKMQKKKTSILRKQRTRNLRNKFKRDLQKKEIANENLELNFAKRLPKNRKIDWENIAKKKITLDHQFCFVRNTGNFCP